MERVLVGPSSKRAAATAAATLLCAALLACGGGNNPQSPGTQPSPTPPQPTPSPVAGIGSDHLHVMQHPYGYDHPAEVITYGIERATGRLRAPVTQTLGDARSLASDPTGRFVYASHGEWSGHGQWVSGTDLTVATYAPDPKDGSLRDVSVAVVDARGSTADYADASWVWLRAGAHRLHGLLLHQWDDPANCDYHTLYSYVSIAVDGDGRLGPTKRHDFVLDGDSGSVIVDVVADMLYKRGTYDWRDPVSGHVHGGLTAHAITADGDIRATGWTDLCLGSKIHWPTPLVAARDFLFASVPNDNSYGDRLCSYRGQRLKTWEDLGFTAWVAEAFVSAPQTTPALIAMSVKVPTGPSTSRAELQLVAMNGDGGLSTLSTAEFAASQIRFHPSGRYLYVTGGDWRQPQLRTYAIDADHRLTPLETFDRASGSMAVTVTTSTAGDN